MSELIYDPWVLQVGGGLLVSLITAIFTVVKTKSTRLGTGCVAIILPVALIAIPGPIDDATVLIATGVIGGSGAALTFINSLKSKK